jgi:elongation factor Ts
MEISVDLIKKLREATGSGILDVKEALQNSDGDFEKAVDYLRQKGLAKAAKRSDRDASEGVIELYSHGDGRVGVMVEINCESDFVARSEAFKEFAHEVALQIAAAAPKWVKEDHVPDDVIEREKEIARSRYKEEGKPDNIIDKILEGMVVKFKTDNCLLSQAYIRDEDLTIQELLHEKIASIGENIVVRRFERWERGESID